MLKRLGEILTEAGKATDPDIARGLRVQAEVGGPLGQILVRLGVVSEADLLQALSRQLGVKILKPGELPDAEAIYAAAQKLRAPASWWRERSAVAWELDGRVICAAAFPLDPVLRETLSSSAAEVEYRLAPRALLDEMLGAVAEPVQSTAFAASDDPERLREMAQEGRVIDFVNAMFSEAVQSRASDIHIEPYEHEYRVRLRVDGVLQPWRSGPRAEFDAVSSRIKLLSGMDIGERRLPQDGRQAVRVGGRELDLRVSALPAAWGESIVLRLLGKTTKLPELTELGLESGQADQLLRLSETPNGILLVSGPTGSGKTTTIYRLLVHLNDGERKIITVEDPVELDLPGVVQVQVRADIGLTFASGLRSILRQDPDVILVGEIRDPETARIAVQAALTGHLVISTVHTNTALAAVSRLVDLGVEPYLLADVLRGVVGQRLVRRLCPHCSMPAPDDEAAQAEALAESLNVAIEERRWNAPRGCPACSNTGYVSRLGIYEIAAMTAEMQTLLRTRADEAQLEASARQGGFQTLLEDGLRKASRGETSVSEVLRVATVEMDSVA